MGRALASAEEIPGSIPGRQGFPGEKRSLASGVIRKHPPKSHIYRRLSENLRAAERGLTQVERTHRDAIRRNDEPAIEFAERMHQLMVGMNAEAALGKIANDPAGFNDKERDLVLNRSQIGRWEKAVELAFRRHYSVPLHLEVDPSTVDARSAERYSEVTKILADDLAAVIEDRNKIAHGQWVWLLKSKRNEVRGPAPAPLNYTAIRARSKAIKAIAGLIYDLVVSEPTFQRDYDDHYRKIVEAHKSFDGADYPNYVVELRRRNR